MTSKKRGSQLSWYHTLTFGQMLINIIKKGKKNTSKLRGHKPNPVKLHRSVGRKPCQKNSREYNVMKQKKLVHTKQKNLIGI